MPKRKRKLQQQQPAFITRVGPGGTNIPTNMSPRSGGRTGGREVRDVDPMRDANVVGDIDEFGNVQRRGPLPTQQPTKKPIVKMGVDAAGNIIKDAVTSDGAQDLMRQAAGEAGRMAAGAAGDLAKGAMSKAKQAMDNRKRRKQNPQPQASGGNPNNKYTSGGDNMRKGNGNGNGGRRGGGGGGSAYEPQDWDSGLATGPFAAAPSGPRVYLYAPSDPTLDKIPSVEQKLFTAGENGKYQNQQIRTQIHVINWNNAYKFNIKGSDSNVIQDTVNTVISNVWIDKHSAIIQDAISYKRGTNNDIQNTLTFPKTTEYHNVGIRGHALIAESNARRTFLPEYFEQNQALSVIKTKLDADTKLMTLIEELKFKLSNIVLPPEVMKQVCWMYQVNKNIPETGSDISIAMSHYMVKDLLDTTTTQFTHMQSEVQNIIDLLSQSVTVAPALTNLEYQTITQYLREGRFPYQLMGNHVLGHPKMDYDPVWNDMWSNMAIYNTDAVEGRYNLFGEFSDTEFLQTAFSTSPNNVSIASVAPLIMNFGTFGTNNNTSIKRSAFPYWGLSVPKATYDQAEYNNTNNFVLRLRTTVPKSVTVEPTTGSMNHFTPHIFNWGASAINDFKFKEVSEATRTPNYLKQRGENVYMYKPSKESVQDAVKRFFIQMESMESCVPLDLRN